MVEIQVTLAERSYPILIREGGLQDIGRDLAARAVAKRFAIISDECVAELYGKALLASCAAGGLDVELFTFPPGENHKNLTTLGYLASQLARAGYDRQDAIIGFGGGVPGDVAGYLAASYMRGIPFVQIPTTLLAQVDSSVGGKTGVDIPEGKNLLGAFYQPEVVYIDPAMLRTLPEEELLGGLAEVIKYGVIQDREFFQFLQNFREDILHLEAGIIEQVVCRCCEIKADVVATDERESGLRRILNFGHTIGHAVEGASNFTLIHGLAVSIGMVAATRLATITGLLSASDRDVIITTLQEYGMPLYVPSKLDRSEIKKYLLTDKKAVGGKVFYILPTAIGETVVTDDITEEQIDFVLEPN